jgi:hypothetical protein
MFSADLSPTIRFYLPFILPWRAAGDPDTAIQRNQCRQEQMLKFRGIIIKKGRRLRRFLLIIKGALPLYPKKLPRIAKK